MNAKMRGGTRRDPSRRTDGDTVALYADLLGMPLLPWQKYVADVAGELDENGTYYYDTIILSTPRQCGKSALIDIMQTRNAQWCPDRFVYYLAQTGKDADNHFKQYVKKLHDGKLGQIAGRPRLANGSMRQPFINGSVIMPMSVTKVAGHGVQGDQITIDEAFSLSLDTGNSILDGFLPTTATRRVKTGVQPQVWITSTEGTADSTFFNERIDACRRGDNSPHTAWFDFGIPEDSDPNDLDVIYAHHPAAGYLWKRGQLERFRDGFGADLAGWARAFGNRRDDGVKDRLIDAQLWDSTGEAKINPNELMKSGRRFVFSVAVDVEAMATAIGVAADATTGIVVDIADLLPGVGSAPARIRQLQAKYRVPIVIDMKGTSANLYEALSATDAYGNPEYDLMTPTSYDVLSMGQAFMTGLTEGTITHGDDERLNASAANATRKWVGDLWKPDRRNNAGHSSPLDAVMLAAWGLTHLPDDNSPIQVY